VRNLLLVTVLWAFSFSLIGVFLAGKVDSYFAVLMRIVLAGLIFLPLTRWRGVPGGLKGGITLVGSLQFGITYICFYQSFLYLSVPEVLLFTIFTPLYVSLIDDAINRRFSLAPFVATAIAVLGAGVIRFDGLSDDFVFGFVLLQVANFSFAAGQVGYANLMSRFPLELPAWRSFGYFYLGALVVVLPTWLLLGNPQKMPTDFTQWGVLVWLGVMASGLGLYLWNRGACQVDAGTLGIMNNALVPAGLVVNLLIWNRDADLGRLAIGGAIIGLSLWVNARWNRWFQLSPVAEPGR